MLRYMIPFGESEGFCAPLHNYRKPPVKLFCSVPGVLPNEDINFQEKAERLTMNTMAKSKAVLPSSPSDTESNPNDTYKELKGFAG